MRHQEIRAMVRNMAQGDRMALLSEAHKAGDHDTLIAIASVQPYRHYFLNTSYQLDFYEGVALVPDGSGSYITNFPDQQHANNVAKNTETSCRFRALTRIIKTLRNEMKENGYAVAEPIPSYLIECLVWNWPSPEFDAASWYEMALRFLWATMNSTFFEQQSAQLMEENNIKTLFGPHTKRFSGRIIAGLERKFTHSALPRTLI